jgi:hypothetical protein
MGPATRTSGVLVVHSEGGEERPLPAKGCGVSILEFLFQEAEISEEVWRKYARQCPKECITGLHFLMRSAKREGNEEMVEKIKRCAAIAIRREVNP